VTLGRNRTKCGPPESRPSELNGWPQATVMGHVTTASLAIRFWRAAMVSASHVEFLASPEVKAR
jgi:hypothetical protein